MASTENTTQCDQIWQNFATLAQFKSLGHIFGGLISVWRNVDPTGAKMFYSWANFHCNRWPNTLK